MENDTWIRCACYTEGINLEYDEHDDVFYLSMWDQNPYVLDWRGRLRHAWNSLRTGKPFKDQMILDREAAAKLANAIGKRLNIQVPPSGPGPRGMVEKIN